MCGIGLTDTFYIDAFDSCLQDSGIDTLAKSGQRSEYTICEPRL